MLKVGYSRKECVPQIMDLDECINERKENFLLLRIASINEYKCTQKIIGKIELLELIGLSEDTARQSVLIGLRTTTVQLKN